MSSSIPDPVPPHATPEQLRHIINYWRIEANCNYGRWIAALDELSELRKSSFVTAVPSEEYEKLKVENERLRKAGYAMAIKINVHGIADNFTDSQKLVDDWSAAAEEGRGAK